MPPRDPDAAAVALFRDHTIPNVAQTMKMGRPIFDDVEVCEIRFAGSRAISVFPAVAVSHWDTDPTTGESIPITYAERFARQYQQYKARAAQTKAGTPIAYLPTITEARRAELRALNIYTVEALADIDGQPLKNLGPGGRDMKNKAIAYMEDARTRVAPNTAMEEELALLKARNAVLEQDADIRNADVENIKDKPGKQKATDPDDIFDTMTLDDLRAYITSNTGHPPHGSLGRKTLLRMAQDARTAQKEVAA